MARFGLDSDSESGSESQASTSSPPPPRGAKTTPSRASKTRRSRSRSTAHDESDDSGDAPPRASLMRSDDDEEEDEDASMDEQDQRSRRDASTASARSYANTYDDDRASSSSQSDQSNTPSPRRRPLVRRSVSVVSTVGTDRERATPWPKTLKLEPKRVAVMQASFFHQGAPAQDKLVTEREAEKERKKAAAAAAAAAGPGGMGMPRAESAAPSVAARPSFVAPVVDPTPLRQFRKYTRVDLSTSVTAGKEGNFIDAGLMLGRSFRVGWGSDGRIVHLGSLYHSPKPAQSDILTIDKLKVLPTTNALNTTQTVATLTLQLAHTPIYTSSGSSIPFAVTHPELRFSHFVSPLSPLDRSPEAHLFRLGHALFDEIDDLAAPDDATRELVDRITEIRRRDLLEKWLEDVVRGDVEEDLRDAAAAGSDGAERVFVLLSGHQVERACDAAIEGKDLRLATLVAQAGGDDDFREDVFLQLAKWREYRVDAHIGNEYRRVYELLCGNVGRSEGIAKGDKVDGADELHVAEGLDWKRAFGLHLWYGTFQASLASVVQRYEDATADQEVSNPLPAYLEKPETAPAYSTTWTSSPDAPVDPLFQLIKIFTDPTHPLELALLPRNFGPSPLDYRLPWHLYILFSRVLRRRDFEDRVEVGEEDEGIEGNSPRADMVTESYATQLELQGLWQWAVFVLLHLELPEKRAKAIQEVLARHVGDIDIEQNDFLVETLKLPQEWIYSAQALAAKHNGDVYDEYELLLEALRPNEAHAIAVLELGPEAVIRNDMALLRKLFSRFKEHEVADWESGGKIFVDYADCVQELQRRAPTQRLSGMLLDLIHAVPTLAEKGPGLKLKVAVSEMQSRLTIISSTLNEHSNAIRPSTLQEADRLVWLKGANAAFFADSLKLASATL